MTDINFIIAFKPTFYITPIIKIIFQSSIFIFEDTIFLTSNLLLLETV